jgi:hypothetical protein
MNCAISQISLCWSENFTPSDKFESPEAQDHLFRFPFALSNFVVNLSPTRPRNSTFSMYPPPRRLASSSSFISAPDDSTCDSQSIFDLSKVESFFGLAFTSAFKPPPLGLALRPEAKALWTDEVSGETSASPTIGAALSGGDCGSEVLEEGSKVDGNGEFNKLEFDAD